jgi:hypothetical protein
MPGGKGKDIYTCIHSEGKVCMRARGIANWGCSCIIYTLFTRSDQSVAERWCFGRDLKSNTMLSFFRERDGA